MRVVNIKEVSDNLDSRVNILFVIFTVDTALQVRFYGDVSSLMTSTYLARQESPAIHQPRLPISSLYHHWSSKQSSSTLNITRTYIGALWNKSSHCDMKWYTGNKEVAWPNWEIGHLTNRKIRVNLPSITIAFPSKNSERMILNFVSDKATLAFSLKVDDNCQLCNWMIAWEMM